MLLTTDATARERLIAAFPDCWSGRPAVAPESGQLAAVKRNGEAGAATGEAHADRTWLVGLHFRNANPDAAADLVLRLALAVRPLRERGEPAAGCSQRQRLRQSLRVTAACFF